MSKYIIELDDRIKLVTSVGVTENGVVYTTSDYVHNLEELNIDYINEHYGELQDEAYKRGYDDGYEAGCATAFKPVSDAEYQRGLEDAWEATKKIALMDTETSENVTGYFGLFRIMENLTAMQAIAKLKAYEDKQKADRIEVGDEVNWLGDCFIVTRIFQPRNMKEQCDGIDDDGCVYHDVLMDDLTKTGKHYDIASILEAMRK